MCLLAHGVFGKEDWIHDQCEHLHSPVPWDLVQPSSKAIGGDWITTPSRIIPGGLSLPWGSSGATWESVPGPCWQRLSHHCAPGQCHRFDDLTCCLGRHGFTCWVFFSPATIQTEEKAECPPPASRARIWSCGPGGAQEEQQTAFRWWDACLAQAFGFPWPPTTGILMKTIENQFLVTRGDYMTNSMLSSFWIVPPFTNDEKKHPLIEKTGLTFYPLICWGIQ